MDELKDKGKRVMENIGEKRVDMIQKWEEKSRDFIDTFLLLFGREGRLVSHYISTLCITNSQCSEKQNFCNIGCCQHREGRRVLLVIFRLLAIIVLLLC